MRVFPAKPRGNIYPFAAVIHGRLETADRLALEEWLRANFGEPEILATGESQYTYDPGHRHLAFREELHLMAFMLRFAG